MQRELSRFWQGREVPSSQIKRSIYLFRRDIKARVEPDGSSSWVHSATAGKLLFGKDAAQAFKVQSGVRIPIKPQDLLVKATPTTISYTARGQEKIQANQSTRLLVGECPGWLRTVRLENHGDQPSRARVLTLHDPTSLNYRRERDPPGEIGLNAFNRHDQVVMDDVGDTTGVRVMGFSPRPSIIHMTKDRHRALELLALGELPETSLGMSGSVILMTQHDLDLVPGATAEVQCTSVYHPSSLEAALSAASQRGLERQDEPDGATFSSPNASINFAFEWAKAALFAVEGDECLSDRLWSGPALSILRRDYVERLLESMRASERKDGTLRYLDESPSAEPKERPGPTETSLYLIGLCAFLNVRSGDKRLLKRWYPRVKKVGDGLSRLVSSGLVLSSANSPDGWRRRLGAGFPTGFTAEVNLLAVRALRDASTIASFLGKNDDSARFLEVSERTLGAINEKLRESESGALALNLDGRGVLHKETTIDQAVGLSYFSPDMTLASSAVHRLLENDFETGHGPRTVPSSNNLYYSPSYAEGQLGGYWTRAAISHAILAYLTGYPGVGSLQLEKVAKLVHLDSERMGGVPGEFPYWMDPERRLISSHGSDPVAASRFIEALVFGELGLFFVREGPAFKLPAASRMKWLLVRDLEIGRKCSIFVGRSQRGGFVVSNFDRRAFEESSRGRDATVTPMCLPECAGGSYAPGIESALFWDNETSILCLGNSTSSPWTGRLLVPAKPRSLSTALFAQVEELQEQTGLWEKRERTKVVKGLEVGADLRPGSWKILKVSPLKQ